jgi:peptide/nickel transport system substrate-binding protein
MRLTGRAAVVGLALSALFCGRAAAPKPRSVTLSVPYELESLDPHARNRLSDFAVLSNVFEPLVTTDASMSIKPCLAERWDNPDYVTWVFHLRERVTFHDGRTLTADDVVASFQRLLTNDALEMGGYIWNLASVRALDEKTVELKTIAPMSILLNKLRFVLIVPRTYRSPADPASGTGPYKLVSWKKGEEVRLARNETYWGPKPPLESATYRLSRSPEQALSDLLGGRSQLVQCNGKKLEERARSTSEVDVFRQSSIFVKFLGFDVKNAVTPFVPGRPNPFRDRRVRQAINLAIDRPALVARLSTAAVPASQTVPPFIFGFNPAVKETRPDQERAKALLAEAGYPGGFDVTLHVRKIFADAARVVAEMLGGAGVRVTIAESPDREFFEIVAGHRSSFFMSRFGCPTGDSSDILENAVHTIDPLRRFGRSNDGEYSNPEFDRLIETSAALLDMERRRPVLQQAMSVIAEDLALIPLYIDQDVYAVNRAYSWHPRNDNFVLASEVGVR